MSQHRRTEKGGRSSTRPASPARDHGGEGGKLNDAEARGAGHQGAVSNGRSVREHRRRTDGRSSMKQPPNVQDAFLNHARRERLNVIVYLVNGTKLSGRIKNFDRFAIIMEINGVDQLIFKHAISTISGTRQFGNYLNFEAVVGDENKE
jgi:host factor-I protein